MQNYKQPGDTITLTAPSGGVVSGTAYKIAQILVVAVASADATDSFEGMTEGVFELPKTTGAAWTEGELLYWDDSAKEVCTTVAGNLLVGVAVEAAASGATTGIVRLNGTGRADGVSDLQLEDDAVDTAAIQDDAVTAVKAAVFFSTEQTGTGSAQNVAHGLGATPAGVLIVPTDLNPATVGDYTAAEGTHTTTNVVVTVTASKKFKVFAWA